MNHILVFLIFSSAIAAGNALKCYECKTHEKDATNCKGELKECPNADDMCANQAEFTIVDKDNRTTISKGCLSRTNKNYCNNIKLSTTSMWFTEYTECCDSDGCNSGDIVVPKHDKMKNGVVCDSCFAQDDNKCEKEKMECKGNQVKCFYFDGSVKRPGLEFIKYKFSGCASAELCEIDFSYLIGCVVDEKAAFTCSSK